MNTTIQSLKALIKVSEAAHICILIAGGICVNFGCVGVNQRSGLGGSVYTQTLIPLAITHAHRSRSVITHTLIYVQQASKPTKTDCVFLMVVL